MTNKLTKMKAFEMIKELVEGNEELTTFVNNEIVLLKKRQNSVSKIKQEKVEERERLAAAIIDLLSNSEEPISASQIGSFIGISAQKAVPILKKLVEEGKITKETVKRQNFYVLADV